MSEVTKETKEASADNATAEKKVKKAKVKKASVVANCYIYAGFGNTLITITDLKGDTICWSSSGTQGFKGSRKGTPFAAQVTAEVIGQKAIEAGVKSIAVYLVGPGAGREPAIRSLAASGLKIVSLRDITPIPHNGCRPPKRRRI